VGGRPHPRGTLDNVQAAGRDDRPPDSGGGAGTNTAKRKSMDTILIVDVDPDRADLICGMLLKNAVPSRR